MSTVQVRRQVLTVQNKVHQGVTNSQKRTVAPERTRISHIYQNKTNDQHAQKPVSGAKLEPIENASLPLDFLQQSDINDIIKTKESLSIKRLPAIKVSYRTNKKFMESPNDDGFSRIIRPHLSMNTYSPGHYIFTEGISKSSVIKSPSFALQQVGVPYSNLPDSIALYKEKNKFAFGVKGTNSEQEKPAYRVSSKQLKIGDATVIPVLASPPKLKPEVVQKPKRGSRSNPGRTSLEIKSNIIKLQPLVIRDPTKAEFDVISIPGQIGPARPPLVPSNSFLQTEEKTEVKTQETKPSSTKDKTDKQAAGERKLSVVSIGDTVGPTFYDAKKQETRQLYPMYNLQSIKNENFRRQKFEYQDGRTFQTKPQLPSSTFTYKVSTRGLSFVEDISPDKFKPIKNNLKDSKGNIIHKQRGLIRNPLSSSDETKSSDYNFRRYYRRIFHRPRSSDTHCTDLSQIPGNPPPSEISHVYSDDGPILINDVRNGMLTLVEERTLTASNFSIRKENTPADIGNENVNEIGIPAVPKLNDINNQDDVDTCTDTDAQFDNALKVAERYKELESCRTDIGKSTGRESSKPDSLKQTESVKNNETAKSICHSVVKSESTVVEKYIAEAEKRLKDDLLNEGDHPNGTGKLEATDEGVLGTDKIRTQIKAKQAENKHLLAVPTLPLDLVAQKSGMPVAKERTSFSRKMQNLDISETTSVAKSINTNDEANVDQGNLTKVSVTRLRLFSNTSTLSAPSVNLSDEKGEVQQLIEENSPFTIDCRIEYDSSHEDSRSSGQSEKKVINHSNVPFIYPRDRDVKAKRQ